MTWLKMLDMPDITFRFDVVEIAMTEPPGEIRAPRKTPFSFRQLFVLKTAPCAFFPASSPSTLHLGNYFGVMKPAIELREKSEAFILSPICTPSRPCGTPGRSVKTSAKSPSIFSRAASIREKPVFSANHMCTR